MNTAPGTIRIRSPPDHAYGRSEHVMHVMHVMHVRASSVLPSSAEVAYRPGSARSRFFKGT